MTKSNEELAHDAAIDIGIFLAKRNDDGTYPINAVAQRILTALNKINGTAPVINELVAERDKLIKIIQILWKADDYATHEHEKNLTPPHYNCLCRWDRSRDEADCKCGYVEAMKQYKSLFSHPPTELNVDAILAQYDDTENKKEQPSSRENSKEN